MVRPVAKVARSAALGEAGPGASRSGSRPASGNVTAADAPSAALLDLLCESHEREEEQGCEKTGESFHESLLRFAYKSALQEVLREWLTGFGAGFAATRSSASLCWHLGGICLIAASSPAMSNCTDIS